MSAQRIHHVAVTVTDFEKSKKFYTRLFEHLGATLVLDIVGAPHKDPEGRFALFAGKDFMFGVWEAMKEFRGNKFDRYNVGLHHIALAAPSRSAIDDFYKKLLADKVPILDAPAEYPYAPGYYAVYFTDPDGIKLEYAHMSG